MAPDLPGHGQDKTPLSAGTFAAYVDSVCHVVDAQLEPVLLVGHSMGGGIITQVAEDRSDKVKVLVYLTAELPLNGESMPQGLQADAKSLLFPNFVVSGDKTSGTFRTETLREVFYGDRSDAALARALLVRLPLAGSSGNAGPDECRQLWAGSSGPHRMSARPGADTMDAEAAVHGPALSASDFDGHQPLALFLRPWRVSGAFGSAIAERNAGQAHLAVHVTAV